MMFNFVRTIALDIFGTMYVVYKDSVALFPAIFALRNIWVHVCTIDCSDVTFYIKAPINKTFSFRATLSILYINWDNSYIRLWGYFDNLRLRSKNNIVEDVCGLNDLFNDVRQNMSVRVFNDIENI